MPTGSDMDMYSSCKILRCSHNEIHHGGTRFYTYVYFYCHVWRKMRKTHGDCNTHVRRYNQPENSSSLGWAKGHTFLPHFP